MATHSSILAWRIPEMGQPGGHLERGRGGANPGGAGRVKHLEGMLLLLLLSHFSHVRLCATPQMAAQQAPPFLGFSRQEHWSACAHTHADMCVYASMHVWVRIDVHPHLCADRLCATP